MPTPTEKYQADLNAGTLMPDPAQAAAVAQLQRVYDDFLAEQQASQRLLKRFERSLGFCDLQPVQGLYLWGGVGIGKTYLMDTFFNCLPTGKKSRLHFHRFMKEVHDDLQRLQGVKDPLKMVAQDIADQADIICFDEFFVSDIGDAMILGNLLDALFKRGVTLVATSNVVPDELYRNGLQRELFLPAITLLNEYTQVFHVNTDKDYRLRELKKAGVYYSPLDAASETKMTDMFARMAQGFDVLTQPLMIDSRAIPTIKYASNVAWFAFKDLCSVPRSQVDYLEIASQFQTVLVSQVPKISAKETNAVTYLINLVDVFYDANVKLILSAAVGIDELYTEGAKVFEFQRTQSRLWEMQSHEYLSRPHR